MEVRMLVPILPIRITMKAVMLLKIQAIRV
jgi:hypothetical protein